MVAAASARETSSTGSETPTARTGIPCARAIVARPAYCQTVPGMYLPSCAWKKTPAQRRCVSTPRRRRIESQTNAPAPTPITETANAPASASQSTRASSTWLSFQIERSRTIGEHECRS